MSGTDWQLAHVTVARLRFPPGDRRCAELVSALDQVYALADHAPGLVWRRPTTRESLVPDGSAGFMVNVSVWTDYLRLHEYTYRTRHMHHLRRRAAWFEPSEHPTSALWWVTAGSRPTDAQARARLAQLRRYGPTPQAFTMRRRFTPDGRRDIPWTSRPAGRRP
ncbi:DUF3291 domain-containing protein [Spongisporangium articulatum]|uniref:DUF3291 domain-containing protein n=1 Tax=Spongisporangium articulatum TaxID=3362603 RepID=A0ABW8AP25_9ACTN